MRWTILLTSFVLFAFLRHTWAVNDNQCEAANTAPAIDERFACPAPGYDCPTVDDIWCGTGTACLPRAMWCDGNIPAVTPDGTECPNNADEGTFCAAAACTGCTVLTTLTGTNIIGTGRACKPVFWNPPQAASAADVMISDCNHFPGTTFPISNTMPMTTPVVYTLNVDTLAPNRYCQFDVVIPQGPCDPVVNNCPNANKMMTADAGETTAIVTWTEITTDATNTVTINNEAYRPGSAFPIGYTKVIYTITKPDGTESFCIFYVHVEANPSTPSALTCPLMAVDKEINPPATSSSVQTELDAFLAPVPTTVTVTKSHETNYVFPLGETQFVVTLTAADGTSIPCEATITIRYPPDTSPPVISGCPTTSPTVCYKTGATVAEGSWTEPTVMDNVGVKSFISNISPDAFLLIPTLAMPGPVTVTYTATDYVDQTSTCTFDLTFLEDTVSPTITNCPDHVEYTTQATGTVAVNYPKPTYKDNCSGLTVTDGGKPPGSQFQVGSATTVMYSVTDKAGNDAATCSFTVTVTVDQSPTFNNCPANILVATQTGATSGVATWTAPTVADDNGLNAANVQLSITPAIDGVILDASAATHTYTLQKGAYTVTYSYTDVNLQKGACTFSITVQDQEAPVFSTCPSAMEVNLAAGETTKVVTWTEPTASDTAGNVVITLKAGSSPSGTAFSSGQFTVEYVATDEAMNTAPCVFIVTVNPYDTNNFWIGCPVSVPTQATDAGSPRAVVTWNAPQLRSDITNPNVNINYNPGASFPIGDTRVQYIVTDRAQNTETCAFTVTVIDTENPVITGCPGDVVAYGLSSQAGVPVYWPEPRTSDNSGSTLTLTASPNGPGTVFGYGNHQISYTATDPSGNQGRGCNTQIRVVVASDPDVISGSAEFSSIRGQGSASATSQGANLGEDLNKLLRENTAIAGIIAGVQGGTPSVLSNGRILAPFNIYLQECRAANLHIRDSLTQNLKGSSRDTFDSNNVIFSDTFKLNTKEFLITPLTIDRDLTLPADQQELIYNGDYGNSRTSAYQALEKRICDIMDSLYSGFTQYCGCDVWQFRAGSVVADMVLMFQGGSPVSQAALSDQLQNSIINGQLQNLVLQNSALATITEVCPDGYCQNGGTCEPNAANYQSQCRCPTAYTGTQCQTSTGPNGPNPTTAPNNPDDGLSTEEIIGIVVGAVGGLLLLVILLACCCVFCLRPADPKSQPFIQEPPEPIFTVEPSRRPVLVRDIVEPPPFRPPFRPRLPQQVPVPRPFPVPVPVPIRAPFPAPFRVPVPMPVAQRFPVPFRQAVPVPQRIPFPVPSPFAVPTPVRFPVNVGVPVREQVPVFTPYGVPNVARQPLGPGLGTGFGARGFSTGLNNGFANQFQ